MGPSHRTSLQNPQNLRASTRCQELNWLPRMVLALTLPPTSARPQKFAGPAAAMLQLFPRFHLDLASRLGSYPLHQAGPEPQTLTPDSSTLHAAAVPPLPPGPGPPPGQLAPASYKP